MSSRVKRKVSMCTPKQMICVEKIEIDDSRCMHQCSGLLVTSYDQEDIENLDIKILYTMFTDHIKRLNDIFWDKDITADIKGIIIIHIKLFHQITCFRNENNKFRDR